MDRLQHFLASRLHLLVFAIGFLIGFWTSGTVTESIWYALAGGALVGFGMWCPEYLARTARNQRATAGEEDV